MKNHKTIHDLTKRAPAKEDHPKQKLREPMRERKTNKVQANARIKQGSEKVFPIGLRRLKGKSSKEKFYEGGFVNKEK